jgi:hypothetical protein
MEDKVPKEMRVEASNIVLKGTPTWWWAAREDISKSSEVVESMQVRFNTPKDRKLFNRYKGIEDPKEHVQLCQNKRTKIKCPKTQWTH